MEAFYETTPPAWRNRALVLAMLLGGVLLRTAALQPMSTTMVHYDEAYNAVDALGLLRHFRLTPFLPGNFGRESGWVYWLMPFLALLGRGLFAVRFAAISAGVLTLAGTYRLGTELLGRHVGAWTMGALAVLYWHVHLSHLALRANLYLLVGALAVAALLRAHRRNRLPAWALGGALLGAMAYTYFASLAWAGYAGVLILGVLVVDGRRRTGAALALACAAVAALPMGLYALQHPDQVLSRSTTVSSGGAAAAVQNGRAWAAALFAHGDPNVLFNLPGRPILGPLLGLLALLGLLGLVFESRRRTRGLLVLGLGVATLVPSLFSNFAPHFLRGAGFTVPLAVVLGIGAAVLSGLLARLGDRVTARLLPLVLLLAVGIVTYRDFAVKWLHDPQTFVAMEMHVNQAVSLIAATTPEDSHVYFTPFTPAHPVIILRAQDLAPRPVGAFNSHECLVLPDATPSESPAVYTSLTVYEPSFASSLGAWAQVSTLYEDPTDGAESPRYSVFAATPYPALGTEVGGFGDQFEVRLLSPIPATVAPGSTLTITLGVRALRTPEIAPSLFIHLYGIPTPYEGGTMWSQADSQLCTSYPAHLWRTDETIIQSFALPLPDDLPSGDYIIGTGLYPFPDGPRLPVTAMADNDDGYVTLRQVSVEGP